MAGEVYVFSPNGSDTTVCLSKPGTDVVPGPSDWHNLSNRLVPGGRLSGNFPGRGRFLALVDNFAGIACHYDFFSPPCFFVIPVSLYRAAY